ncbi:hypothetical protein M409DRAFT_57524 [Zasmidium cellare ATCC 36951]|uniref:Uncharacterized protein n=1 Tax=Zasmidium cellare ATCC 36951 TaxID=1080233 RepID=A0A6A6CAH0_ZASCE|nr:uncharacterized protein M409DRAFT_57524 [Zasmidium cellare ATCC 36951]KAF2163220.1 hypothetical protein M409DRAFT_57524 [Zasmidium cellare ATCC 36951]
MPLCDASAAVAPMPLFRKLGIIKAAFRLDVAQSITTPTHLRNRTSKTQIFEHHQSSRPANSPSIYRQPTPSGMESRLFFETSLAYQNLRAEELAMANDPHTALRDLEYNLSLQAELRESLHTLAKVAAYAEERDRFKARTTSSEMSISPNASPFNTPQK